MNDLLEIRDLRVCFSAVNGNSACVVNGLNLDIKTNETLCLAGESGSGKTITAMSITGILPRHAKIISGQIKYNGRDLLKLNNKELEGIRGSQIAYVFQEPASFLNPVFTIGNQIMEAITLHQDKNRSQAKTEALALLDLVGLKDPERIFLSYPHQLSGGMNQRAFIAMALACSPRLLIADEPTTSLDVTVEAQILKLLLALKEKIGFSLLFITHNLSIAKKIADRICIMHKGTIVEEGTVQSIFNSAQHFHTRELIMAYEKIGKI